MMGLFLVLLAMMQDPLPSPRPPPRLPPQQPPPFQTPLIRPERPVLQPGRLVIVEPNVCAGKQDGFQCGAGTFANVSYWCEAYQPLGRMSCANGCNTANGECRP